MPQDNRFLYQGGDYGSNPFDKLKWYIDKKINLILGYLYGVQTGTTDPTAANVAPGKYIVWYDTSSASLQLWYNNNGSMVQISTGGGGGGGGVALDSATTYTSGSTFTVSSGNNIVYVNPSATVSSISFTFPSTPHNSNVIYFIFSGANGTITSGLVASSLTWMGNTGQFVSGALPTYAAAGQIYAFKFYNNNWTYLP